MPRACFRPPLSTTLEHEAIATVENETTQTDWMGDLSGGLGVGTAAGRGRHSAASGRAGSNVRLLRAQWCSTGIEYCVWIDSIAPADALDLLRASVDEIAEIPRAIRGGAPVRRVV